MSGLQTCWCLAGVVVLLAGMRMGVPAMVQARRRRHWTRHRATVTSVSCRKDVVMTSTGVDDASWHTDMPDELKWFIAYTYWADGSTHEGRSRHRALPPPAPGQHVSVLVHPLRPDRSQFDEPESPLARIAVGLFATAVALPLLTTALGVWAPAGLLPG